MTDVQITVEDMQNPPAGKVVKVVHVVGQFDESNIDEKAKEVYAIIDAVPAGLSLIFEFSGLEYMNSKSIGYLTDWYSKVSGSGGKVVIAAARDNIIDILQVVGLTQLISAYATLEEAKLAIAQ